MKKELKAVLSLGACALCVSLVFLCQTAFAEPAAQPCVQVGAVAQRYPWNGTLDVNYKASGLPAAGTNAVVTVTANGKTYTQDVTLANGASTVAVTALPKDLKAKAAKVMLKLR